MYSGYELYENEPASPDTEEYLHSEKYELRRREWDRADSLAPLVTQLNDIRRRHSAFRWLRNIRFHHSEDDRFLVFSKAHAGEDPMLVVVNLDPHEAHGTTLGLDLAALGLNSGRYLAHDELSGETYTWEGPRPYVHLDPSTGQVAHILRLHVA